MKRVAVDFRRSDRGMFSHFAHFVCDFAMPLYGVLREKNLISSLAAEGVILDLLNRGYTQFGPMLPFVREIFPNLWLNYVPDFQFEPIQVCQQPWYNRPEDIQSFLEYVIDLLHIRPKSYGVILVNRGTDRKHYPGINFNQRSGGDRRRICAGFELLFEGVRAKRPDCFAVVLEDLTLADQISFFLNADTLIAQHGAAFVHAQWMRPGGHLIELQCLQTHRFLHFVECLASLRGHRRSVVDYPCVGHRRNLSMMIDTPEKILELMTGPRAIT